VFRDELKNLMPDHARGRRLSTLVVSLGEFLATHAGSVPKQPLPLKALVHGHCHQQALVGMHADERVLESAGVDCEVLDAGCCGMAGSFGFEHDHYAVSQAVGERRLLPRVRSMPPDTLLIADGFSCREQIAQATGRRAMHLAEVLAMAAQPNAVSDRPRPSLPVRWVAAVLLVAAGAAAARYMRQTTRRTRR
jgi:Fe-S oxidoreductase